MCELTLRGLEAVPATGLDDSTLRDPANSSGAESGAVPAAGAVPHAADAVTATVPDAAKLALAWDRLPVAVREAIAAALEGVVN